jgi:aspartyl-tRNA(Asn)/glutamyl-tRNA(Gln) amidotransferase subunit A
MFAARNILHTKRSSSVQEKCDVILCPTTTGPAPELSSISTLGPVETYVNDVFTVPGSLAGLPAISVPAQVDEHIVGLQIMGQVGSDTLVFAAAKKLEQILGQIE